MLGFIIYGWRTMESRGETGQFHCPFCRSPRQYTLIKLNRYFTLYFFPIIPLGTVAQTVECQTCRRQFEPEVLSLGPSARGSGQEALFATVADQLTAGCSAQEVHGMMVQAGISAQQSQDVLNQVLSGAARHCARCNLHYAKTARACGMCGDALLEA
jgi:zinc-ribbon family